MNRAMKHAMAFALGLGLACPSVSAAWAGGGGGMGNASITGLNAVAAAIEATGKAAVAASQTMSQQATTAANTPVGVSVGTVTARSDAVGIGVDVSIGRDGDIRIYRRVVVLPIALQAVSSNPKALAVALSGVVGRMLIEDVSKLLSANAALAQGVRTAGERVAGLREADFPISPS